MALIGNRSVLNKSPGRFLNAGVATFRSTFNKHGMARNAYQSFSAFSSIPAGARPPISWVMAKTAGGLASHNACFVSVAGTGSGAEGYNIAGQSTLTIDSTAIGGLIAGGVGTAYLSLVAGGAVTATIGSTGSASISVGGSAAIGAIGWVFGEAIATVTGTLTPYAKGHMVGTTAESGLSNVGIANSVWAKVIEAGFSAEQIFRIIAAQSAGAATGLESGNPQFTGLDGSTVRIDGTYIAGTRTIDTLNGD